MSNVKNFCSMKKTVIKQTAKTKPAVSIQMREIMDKVWETEKMQNLLNESITSHLIYLNLNTREKLNDMVYKLAKETGRSIWDICFSYVPVYEEAEIDLSKEEPCRYKVTASRNLKLVPIDHDLKFINLVREMRKLQKCHKVDINHVENMCKAERLVDEWLEGNHEGFFI